MQTSLSQFFSTPRASTLSAKMMAQIEQRQSKTTPRRKKGPKLKSIENSGASSTPPPKFEQLIMDLGQKNIGVQHCTKVRGKNNTWTCGHCIECGMVYSQENPSDVKQHEKYHNRFEEIRNFRVTASQLNSWTKNLPYEDITAPIPGILFTLKPNSKATLRRKLDDILTNFVNEELGLQNDHQKALDSSDEEQRHAFVFIAETSNSNDRNSLQTSSSVSSSSSTNGGPAFIAGILLIGYVQEIICMPEEKHFKGKFLGVDRIWVHSFQRHKRIATFMLDSARRLMANSTDQFSRLRVAFSDPSNLGIKLAISYANQHQTKDKENIKAGGRYLIYTPAIPNTVVGSLGRADALIKKLSNTNSTKTNSTGSPEL